MSKREFLQSTCKAALIAIIPLELNSSVAYASRLLHGTSSFVFNGGKVQANPSFFNGAGDFPTINVMKVGLDWVYINTGGDVNPSDLDSNGYPTVINNGGVFTTVTVPTTQWPSGGGNTNWVISWDSSSAGTTNCSINGTAFPASGTGPKSFVFTKPASGSWNIGISTTGVSNLQVYWQDYAASLAVSQWAPSYISFLKQVPIGVLRWMDWCAQEAGGAGDCNITTWATRKPASYYSWFASDYGRCPIVTATYTYPSSVDTYSVTSGSGAPADKTTIIFTFPHSAANGNGPWALNYNGNVAPMLGLTTLSNNNGNAAPISGRNTAATYNAVLNVWQISGCQTNFGSSSQGISNGVPPEQFADLCYRVGCHPYYNIPFLSADQQASPFVCDFAAQLATYIKTTYQDTGLASWMIPRFEGPNESWNRVLIYCNTMALTYWSGTITNPIGKSQAIPDSFWYGRSISNIAQQINAVYGSPNPKTQTKYQILAGVQSSQALTPTLMNGRLNCNRTVGFKNVTYNYNASGGTRGVSCPGNTYANGDRVTFGASSDGFPPNGIDVETPITYFVVNSITGVSGSFDIALTLGGTPINLTIQGGIISTFNCVYTASVGSEAVNWVTHICFTNYINSSYQDTNFDISGGFKWVQAVANNDLTTMQSVANTYISGNNVGVYAGGSSTGLAASYVDWIAWANSFGPVMKACSYEGGWSPDYTNNVLPAYSVIAGITTGATTLVKFSAVFLNGSALGPTIASASDIAAVVGMPIAPFGFTDAVQFNCQSASVSLNATGSIVTWTSHGLSVGDAVTFLSAGVTHGIWSPVGIGEVATGVSSGIVYYVISTPTGNTFTFSKTKGGPQQTFTNVTSLWTVSCSKCFPVKSINVGGDPTVVELDVDSTGFTAHTPYTIAYNSSALFTLASHGFANGQNIQFTGTLPSGLTANYVYSIANVTTNTFTVQTRSFVGGGVVYTDVTSLIGSGNVTAWTNTYAYYGFNAPNSGGATGAMYTNAARFGSKWGSDLEAATLLNYQNQIAAGCEFPSIFTYSGGGIWAEWDDNIFLNDNPPPWLAGSAPPQWLGAKDFG